jgi:hypothetical protein
VFLLVALTTPVIYGGEPARGVAGVDVVVKQRPSDHAVTDARGNFAIEALAAGSYTLTFRARKAEDLHYSTSDKVIVAELYSIKIEVIANSVRRPQPARRRSCHSRHGQSRCNCPAGACAQSPTPSRSMAVCLSR